MTALLKQRAHYAVQADFAGAIALVNALRDLEQRQRDADKAHQYCGPEDQQVCDMALLDARVETCRVMGLVGLDMRVTGRALS